MNWKEITFFALSVLFVLPAAIYVIPVAQNEWHLRAVEKKAAAIPHPDGARNEKHAIAVGNLAPASNQCAFAIVDYWSTELSREEITKFYEPYLVDTMEARAMGIYLYFLDALRPDFDSIYGDTFDYDASEVEPSRTIYLVLVHEGGYPPNLDIRCH